MSEAVILSACHTAIGAFGRAVRDMHAATISSVPECPTYSVMQRTAERQYNPEAI
ncbi:MAG: hypothetical protein ACLP5H_24150 [Desulfomonilaceae bacterium]